MAIISLKISNVHENGLELISRLRGVKTPGKKILLESIKNNDWKSVYAELLYRIELYAALKVLNYPKQIVNDTALNVKKVGLQVLVDAMYDKYISPMFVNEQFYSADAIMQLNESEDYDDLFESLNKVDSDLFQLVQTELENYGFEPIWFQFFFDNKLKKDWVNFIDVYENTLNDFKREKGSQNDQMFTSITLDFVKNVQRKCMNWWNMLKKENVSDEQLLLLFQVLADLKIKPSFLKKLYKNVVNLNESKSYDEFFKNKLEEFGAKSPADLSKEDKSKFFKQIQDEWEGDEK